MGGDGPEPRCGSETSDGTLSHSPSRLVGGFQGRASTVPSFELSLNRHAGKRCLSRVATAAGT